MAGSESGSLTISISLQNYKYMLLKCLLRNLMKFKIENNLFQKFFDKDYFVERAGWYEQ